MGQPLISKEPADFKTRFLKSLIAPWLFLVVGLLVFLSFKIQFLWVVPLVLVTAFIILNYRAMEQFLEKAELIDNTIEFTFYNSKMDKRLLKIPTSELTVEYYGNGKGFSSLVSQIGRASCRERV